MNNRKHILAVLLTAGIASAPLLYGQAPEEQDIRTIRLLQDDGQVNIVSKLYELKYDGQALLLPADGQDAPP